MSTLASPPSTEHPLPAVLSLIGNTPLVEITRLDTGVCRLFVKLENQNPTGSIKDRVALGMIEAGEAFVRSLGFQVFRVRHHQNGDGPLPRARVQIAPAEMDRLDGQEEILQHGLLAVGYRVVEIDPQGYRSALS